MDLHRGALANLDRRLLAELDREEQFRMVRVPVSAAKWSTWKRYCGAAGISMGRAIVTLIDRELANATETSVDNSSVLAQRYASNWSDERLRLRIGNKRYLQPRRGSAAQASVFVVGRPSYRQWRSGSSWHRS